MGLDRRSTRSACRVRSCSRGLPRRWPGRVRRQRRMVPARSARSLCAAVSGQPWLHDAGERQQYKRIDYNHYECLSDHHHQQEHHDHERQLRQSWRTRRSDGGSATRLRRRAARSPLGSRSECSGTFSRFDICARCRGSADASIGAWSACRFSRSCQCPARGSNESPSDREENSAAAAGSIRQTAAGDGLTPWSATTKTRGAEFASRSRGSGSSSSESCAAGKTGSANHGPSECTGTERRTSRAAWRPAECRATWTAEPAQ